MDFRAPRGGSWIRTSEALQFCRIVNCAEALNPSRLTSWI